MRLQWPEIGLIRNKRKELGITQHDLAERSGVAQPVISRIEDGNISEPSYNVVRRIFNALHDLEVGKIPTNIPIASDLMNKHVVSVTPADRVRDAWVKMKKNGFSQLPVIDDKRRIVGGITERSLPSDDMENIHEKRVQEIMGDSFPIVGKDASMQTLVSMLRTVPAVLVVDRGALCGIITAYDLMENASRKVPHLLK